MYKENQEITYVFPKGTGKQAGTIIRLSKDGTKFQTRTTNGRLMWYPTSCIVEPAKGGDILDLPVTDDKPQQTQKKSALPEELEEVSKDAAEKLQAIKSKKESKKRVGKKDIQSEIKDLILKGWTNKEIFHELNCGHAYPSIVRNKLVKSGEIGKEFLKVKKR